MRTTCLYGASLAALLSAASAFDILSPTPGSGIDPTKPLSILWSVDYDDPAHIDIRFTNADPNAVTTDLTLATGVASYTGSYTVPENTIQNFGTGYQILIISDGNTIASSTGLTLGQSSNQVSTDANGQVTLVSTAASSGASDAAPSTTVSGEQQDSATITTSVPTASIDSVGITTMSGTVTDGEATTSSPSSRASSFVTSTSSRASSSSSSQSSAAATSADSTNTANGQKRLGGEFVLSAAGLLAGIVALLA